MPCGSKASCVISKNKSQIETDGVNSLIRHLQEIENRGATILCTPDENGACNSNVDYLFKIDDEYWFVENIFLTFDQNIENRINSIDPQIAIKCETFALNEGLRILANFKFKEINPSQSATKEILASLDAFILTYSQNRIRGKTTKELANGILQLQIDTDPSTEEISAFGRVLLMHTLNISSDLKEQFELANRRSLEKKFEKQIERMEDVKYTGLLIDQTYKVKKDGVLIGNQIFSENFLLDRLREIDTKFPNRVDKIWLRTPFDEIKAIKLRK